MESKELVNLAPTFELRKLPKLFNSKVETVYKGFLSSFRFKKSFKYPNYSTYVYTDTYGQWVDKSRNKGYTLINESFKISLDNFLNLSELGYVKLRTVFLKNYRLEILFQVYDVHKLEGRLQFYVYYQDGSSEKITTSELLEIKYNEWFKVEVYLDSACYMNEIAGETLKYLLQATAKSSRHEVSLAFNLNRKLNIYYYEIAKLLGFEDTIKVKPLELSEKSANTVSVSYGIGDYHDIRLNFNN